MSQWTHVTGIFRVDEIFNNNIKEDIKNIVEIPIYYNEDNDGEYDYTTPSLYNKMDDSTIEYNVIYNEDINCAENCRIVFWGDIRHCDNYHGFFEWFDNVCDKLSIRQAVISVEIEYDNTYTKHYKKC